MGRHRFNLVTEMADVLTKLDLPRECDCIASKALAGENAIVVLGCLVFWHTGPAMRSRSTSRTNTPARCKPTV
jgi:hypothetical protein